MRFSEQWLREWVSPKLDSDALAECLTLAGLEVSAVEPAGPALDQVVVGEITAVEPHPDAERLRVCAVQVGRRESIPVVCGAPNAAPGMKAPLALPGARLQGGAVIQATRVRGVESAGMLCSATELGLGESAEGLMVLDASAPVGVPMAHFLELEDRVFEIELTPNRGDCLGIGGIAREVSALTSTRVTPPVLAPVPARTKRRAAVRLAAGAGCPRYVGRVVEGIDAGAMTPMWMRERLRRSGQRSINAIVDITNYVMLELGQPMHAFDLERVQPGLHVRRARRGEKLELLDGQTVTPQPGTLLIAGHDGPLALAGVMGGADSAVGDQTQDIFLESAFFDPRAVAGCARELGLQTESSYRFERGVDPALQGVAMERATALVMEICGGRPGPVNDVTLAEHLPQCMPIRLRHGRIQRVLGMVIARDTVMKILTRLGMRLTPHGVDWRVQPPSHRFDICRECDLIEEVARVHGYAAVPERTPKAELFVHVPAEKQWSQRRLRHAMIDRGYQEVVTYSFVEQEVERVLNADARPLPLANPINAEMGVMRTSLWPGLLGVLRHNLHRQHRRVRLFEIGRVFLDGDERLAQPLRIGGVVSGEAAPEHWDVLARPADFFDLKGDVEALAALGGAPGDVDCTAGTHPALHPGQCGELRLRGRRAGWFGVLHPAVRARLDFDQEVLVFEFDAASLLDRRIPHYRPVSRFPAIRRDLSVVVPEAVSAAAIRESVVRAAGESLTKLEFFDVYRGEGIDSTQKSLSFGLTLQDASRTLRDEEIDSIQARIVAALYAELGAILRN